MTEIAKLCEIVTAILRNSKAVFLYESKTMIASTETTDASTYGWQQDENKFDVNNSFRSSVG